MKKIVITGAESSGKSTLATDLSKLYGCELVTEHARTYLEIRMGQYVKEDLTEIAKMQLDAESKAIAISNDLIICDTDILTIILWSKIKYKHVEEEIKSLYNPDDVDLYILCEPNIPWEYDPLRENPNDRNEIFKIYQEELEKIKVNYIVVSGEKEERLKKSIKTIDEILK